MSAVTGLFYLGGQPVEPHQIDAMTDALSHRGPDGRGVWLQGSIGLGHRMLHVTPESLRESLPLRDESADLTITAECRLDNRTELMASLGLGDSSVGDAELILASYRKWGEDSPKHLLGDFAFIIWDGRSQKLFCARDQMGARPLYFCHIPGRMFCVASEIKSLLALPEVPRRLDEQRVADHLTPILEDKESTFFADIRRLPPAHRMLIDVRGAVKDRYWFPDLNTELRFRSDAEAEEQFLDLLKDAVQCRMRSAFPVGSMLSGGLDSSAIACLARDLRPPNQETLPTFSAIWPSLHELDPRCNEMPFIQSVLDTGDFRPHYIHADQISPLTNIETMQWNQDDALPAANLYMDWAVYKETQAQGVRVLFSGTDGDSTVSYGYQDFAEFARRGAWRTMWNEAALVRRTMPSAYHTRKRMLWDYGWKPLLPHWVQRLTDAKSDPAARQPRDLMNAEFARRMDVDNRVKRLYRVGAARYTRAEARRQHWDGVGSGLFAYALESLGKAANNFGVEPVYPFFDIRLIQFCLSLPPHQKLKNGWTRSIFRRAMAGIVPDNVRWRHKKGMIGSNFRLKLRDWDRKYLDQAVLEYPEVLEPWVDIAALRALYDSYTTSDFARDDEAFTMLMPVTLSRYMRTVEFER